MMQRLREHFASLAVRPHHVYFAIEALPRTLFADPAQFDRLACATGSSWLAHLWVAAGRDLRSEHRLPPGGLAVTVVPLRDGEPAAVVSLPPTESRHEADYVVVRRPARRIRLWGQAPALRYFVVVEPIRAPDWNLIIVEEVLPRGQELVVKRRLDREKVSTTPEGLAHLIQGIR